MGRILKKLALLALPVALWLCFFIAFEPNNYFGLKSTASSSQPVARVRAYEQHPGQNLILGDSRLAHLKLEGGDWQNLAFGGASLQEGLDLAEYILESGHEVDTILFELSFYTLNAHYNTDRFAALEKTLHNPLAYCLNLEYNVNALTVFLDTVRGTPDTIESGDWSAPDYFDADGSPIPLHRRLYDYPALIAPKCENWALNDTQYARLRPLAEECAARNIRLVFVLPPMAENVKTEICDRYDITPAMDALLPDLQALCEETGATLLDYEWSSNCITDDDKQFFDGFHLDEKYGLPDWQDELFQDVGNA